MVFGLGPAELGVILLIVIILFGSTKLPELARSLGRAKKEFKEGMDESETSTGKKKKKE